jgi:alkylation response protein AidB-like acyl-CoA dehydrogenase
MDFLDSQDESTFRVQLRAWLAAHADASSVPEDPAARAAAQNAWHQVLYDAGYIGLSFPVEYGGGGRLPTFEAILNDELGRAGAPPIEGVGHMSNAIRLFGSEQQKSDFLPGLLSGKVRWCQGFSEPDAGSDLASLSTRASASADGEHFTINGRKIWTSFASEADWCFLLCRTEPDAAKHKGISVLLVDMTTPGVEATPITNASRNRDFAEVLFDDAVVPAINLLGERGQGWSIANQLLAYERGPSDINWIARLSGHLQALEEEVRLGTIADTEHNRAVLGRCYAHLRALQIKVQRSLTERLHDALPGAEGSIDKLLMTEADQVIGHAVMTLRGARTVTRETHEWDVYTWSRAASIYGGTQQVQRNIVAQRLLGLPRS